MATKHWLGIATAVAQIGTASIDSVDGTPANNTFIVTIGGVAISAVGDTDVATTATNLRASLNASTHPYFTAITWSGSAGDIIGTADTAGVPFVAALTETGAGTGAVTDFAATTASVGPSDWSSADNWSDGAIPASTDTVIFANNSINCVYGLANSAVLLVGLQIEQSYTGKLGLNRSAFTTSADGNTEDATKTEYRDDFLDINVDAIEIGKVLGIGTAAGSGRLKIDNASVDAATIEIFNTANIGAEANLPPVRFKTSHVNTDIFVRAGNVGFGVDAPNEICIIGDVYISGSSTKLFCGTACQITNFTQNNGKSILHSTTTITAVNLYLGVLTTEGDFTITTLNIYGGTLFPNHLKSGGNAITTLNLLGGLIDAVQTGVVRTWATFNPSIGGSLKYDPDQVVITTFNEESRPVTMTYG